MSKDSATSFNEKQVLTFLLHHMGVEMRGKLIRALPDAYNEVVCNNREIAKVVYGKDSDRDGDVLL